MNVYCILYNIFGNDVNIIKITSPSTQEKKYTRKSSKENIPEELEGFCV